MVIRCIFEAMRPEELSGKRILLSPLNWGFGHVSRSIGLIDQLLKQKNEVVVACDKQQERIYMEYFPDLTYVFHEGYDFKFHGKGNFSRDLLFSWSGLRVRMLNETLQVARIAADHKIDIVISDHRYGFYCKVRPSIFVTHQYNLPVKWFQAPIDFVHKRLMKKFREIWIMDEEERPLAGKLSLTMNARSVSYIGHYSRFSIYDIPEEKQIETVAIISGPKIYAQQLADEVTQKYPEAVFVCDETISLPKNVVRISGSWREQDAKILLAKKIISRSGYSTVMDLQFLKAEAEYFPTPGQAEQLYLKKWLTDLN